MPIIKLDLADERFSFLKPLVDRRKIIVDEYNKLVGINTFPGTVNEIQDVEYNHHYSKKNWKLLSLRNLREGINPLVSQFPTISNFFNKLPKNIELILFDISIMGYGDTIWHKEEWTKQNGFKRIHIPLNIVDGVSIDVSEIDGFVNWVYEFDNAYQFTNPYNMHKPSNFNKKRITRILLMIDYIDRNETPDITEDEINELYPIEKFKNSP